MAGYLDPSADHRVDVMVLGGGPGGFSVAPLIKRRKPDWRVVVVRAQANSVVPCALPYALDGTIGFDDFVKSDKKLMFDRGIDLIIDRVEELDLSAMKAKLARGGSVHFDKLLYAAGSRALRPPIPGMELDNVFVVRDAPDIHAIAEAMKSAQRGVVIGGGYIGLEIAIAWNNAGIESHVVEMLPVCLGNVCTEEIGAEATEELRRHGIKVHLQQRVTEITGTGGRATAVRTEEEEIPADMVVVAVGVVPNVELAAEAGIEVGKRGVRVNERMETNVPGVYAVGDCIEFKHFVTGEVTVGPLATNAVVQGKVAGVNITGGHRTFPGLVNPAVTRLYENSYGTTGLNAEQAQKAAIDVVVGEFTGTTRDRPFPGAGEIHARLVFNKANGQLIGAEIRGTEGVPERIDNLSAAILRRDTWQDIAAWQFSGHPPQTDVPARHLLVRAAEDALIKVGLF